MSKKLVNVTKGEATAKAIAGIAGLRFVDNGKLRDGHNGVLRMRRHLYSPTDTQGQEA